jgi:hypothetical protein
VLVLSTGSLLLPLAAHPPVSVDEKWLFMNSVAARTSAYLLPEDEHVTPSDQFATLAYGNQTWVEWENTLSTTVTIYNVSYSFRLRHLAHGTSPELIHHHQVSDTTIMVEPNAFNIIFPPAFSEVFQPDPASYTVEATTTMNWSSFAWEAQHHHDWEQE